MIGEIQQQLQTRFAQLASTRRDLKYPVYALEHGLEDSQLKALRETASHSIRHQAPSEAHWLVWAVLGAEAGYGYSGDEFWPAMEVGVGDWRSNDHRQSLRRFYRRFVTDFGGPQPAGRWAEHFNIIAWPITHAILPRYLQSHFARHLYDCRFDLARLAAGSGEGIGKFLQKEYDGTSSRFRDFLQQTDLTAQIVLALRDESSDGGVARIEPLLLSRIVADLERQPHARSYLRDARKLIQSTNIKVSSRLQLTNGVEHVGTPMGPATPQRPCLVARRQGEGSFLLGLQLPDIALALKLGGVSIGLLNGLRVRFFGPGEPYLPASNLLTLSRKERHLAAFPGSTSPAFSIEDGPPELMRIFDPLSRIEERPCWVLRRQADGLYREIIGGYVRPGQQYLILTRESPSSDGVLQAGLLSVEVKAADVQGHHLITPVHLCNAQKAALETLGLGTVTGVSIDAVGLNPAPCSSDDPPTWLSTEAVTLRLAADFDADAFLVGIDNQDYQKFACDSGQLILQFDQLEPGRHTVKVSIWTRDGKTGRPETFDFQIASPRPWIGAMRDKAGFRLVCEPSTKTIERVFDGQARLHIAGPAGRNVHWSLETYGADGHLAASQTIGVGKVGVGPDVLRSMLEKARTEHAAAIDEAYRIDIVAGLEELGRQALSFPHAVEPLRWKFDARTGIVRLVDETDHAEPVTVREYPLEAPLERKLIDTQTALSGFSVAAPGKLLVATYKKRLVSIFVSFTRAERLHNFSDLGFSQSLSLPESMGLAIIRLIDCLRRWERSKAVGHLGPVRKATTLDKLRTEISAIACGPDFMSDLQSSHPQSGERAQKKVGGSPGFGLRMRTYEWTGDVKSDQNAFDEFALRYGIESDQAWCRAALTLAYDPLLLRLPDNADGPEYFSQLLGKRSLLRGAFLAKAASHAAPIQTRAMA